MWKLLSKIVAPGYHPKWPSLLCLYIQSQAAAVERERESKQSRSCLPSCWVQSPALLLKCSQITFSQHPARGYNKALNSPNHSGGGSGGNLLMAWWRFSASLYILQDTPECVSRAMRSEFSWVDNTKHLRDQIHSASSASYPECTLSHSMNVAVTGQIPKTDFCIDLLRLGVTSLN